MSNQEFIKWLDASSVLQHIRRPYISNWSVGVEHHSEGSSHSSGREVLGELSSDKTVVAVWLDNFAPDNSEFCVVSDALALEDVSDSLAKVKAWVLLIVHTLHLQQSELLVLGTLSSLEANEGSLSVKSKLFMIMSFTYLIGCPEAFFSCFWPSLPIFM